QPLLSAAHVFELSAPLQAVAWGNSTLPPISDWAAFTQLPISRPRTLHWIVIRRLLHSRVMYFAPRTSRMSATRASGIRLPDAVASIRSASFAGLVRYSEGNKTASGNRN